MTSADVIVEKTELFPFGAALPGVVAPAAPPPTVIAYGEAETVILFGALG